MLRLLLTFLLLLPTAALADDSAERSDDDKAIRATVKAYVAAFNKKNADKLAAHWAQDAVYINRTNGLRIKGRDAIGQQFTEMFRDAGEVRLDVKLKSLRFLSDTVAVEEGTARFVSSESPPTESDYIAVYVKQNGKWLLDTVREVDLPQPPSHHQHLKQLAWMIGKWVDQDENATVRTKCEWTRNKNFLKRTFRVSVKDRLQLEGTQIIGYDPTSGQIRSWVFDSDGGFGEAFWTRDGNQWTINAVTTFADGRRGAHVRLLTQIDNDTLTLQTVHREVDGQLLPNIEEFRVVRIRSGIAQK
jgi:uncharacterized protein (TIGR02246 family)